MDINKKSLQMHAKNRGKIEICSKIKLKTSDDLALAYTPGVAEVSRQIAKDKKLIKKYTNVGNTIAIITDGSAVLGLGNIGPEAAMPVMEGKAILFKELAGVDAYPLCLASQDTQSIIKVVELLAPSFSGINLEDISAPRCFEIERQLIEKLNIPVIHDDQHGTAIVVLAGLINALKVAKKKLPDCYIVINGAGAAGVAITKLLLSAGLKNFSILDSKGTISSRRTDLNEDKKALAKFAKKIETDLSGAIKGADVFIGVSQPNLLTKSMVQSMNDKAIIFAMANPIPEIMPDQALLAGALVAATGRSDFPNQINNALVFPGLFRGLLDSGARKVTTEMKLATAQAIAKCVKQPTSKNIIPKVLDKKVPKVIAQVIKKMVTNV
ncbi:MAG: NADP-dependent malic enzyme [bacterium]